MYWFTGIDDAYDFDLLKVALYSAKCNTTLKPVVLYTSLSLNKLKYLESKEIILHQVEVDDKIARGQCNLPRHMYGALLKIYVPMVADMMGISDTILYSDVDVIFVSDPPMQKTAEVLASSYFPLIKPSNTRVITDCDNYDQMFEHGGMMVNAGVMYFNIKAMLPNIEKFLSLCCIPALCSAPAESVYHYYHIDHMSYRYNYFAYWNNDWARCDMRLLESPVILHFHGPKPCFKQQPDCLSHYVTKEFGYYKQIWLDYINIVNNGKGTLPVVKSSGIIASTFYQQWYT